MKIALFCSSRNIVPPRKTGGTEQPIFYLAKGLTERGHEVALYAARGSKVPGVEVREVSPFATCLKQKYLNIQERIASFYDLNALADFFKNEAGQFDIIQFNSYIFYEILPFTKWTRTPIIIRINYPHNLMYPYIKKKLLEYKNVYYLPISRFIKSVMPDLSYLEPIYPAVDLKDFPFSKKHNNYLLFIGRICYNKGVHAAIEAAKLAGKKLIIAGRVDGEDRSYFLTKIKPNIDDRQIKYVGEVDFKEKIKLYRGAEATLFPILWDEPLGNVVVESMACGTPVIAFNRAAMPEVITNGHNGFLVDNISIQAMSGVAQRIKLIDRLNVRKTAENNFNLKRVIDQYEAMYNKIEK